MPQMPCRRSRKFRWKTRRPSDDPRDNGCSSVRRPRGKLGFPGFLEHALESDQFGTVPGGGIGRTGLCPTLQRAEWGTRRHVGMCRLDADWAGDIGPMRRQRFAPLRHCMTRYRIERDNFILLAAAMVRQPCGLNQIARCPTTRFALRMVTPMRITWAFGAASLAISSSTG